MAVTYKHTITTTTADTLHYFISWSSGVYSNSKTPLQISSQGFQKWKPRIATFLQLYLVYNITSRYSYIWWCLLAAISIVKALCSVLTSEESSIWYFAISGFRIILTKYTVEKWASKGKSKRSFLHFHVKLFE